jgi:hypothetical protein
VQTRLAQLGAKSIMHSLPVHFSRDPFQVKSVHAISLTTQMVYLMGSSIDRPMKVLLAMNERVRIAVSLDYTSVRD